MKKLIILNLGLFLVALFALTPIYAADVTDISNSRNEAAINYLIDNNVVQGYEDGTFKPNATINRAEFTKIIVEATYDDATIESCLAEQMKPTWTYAFFPDVDRNAWFAKYICVAKIKGVVKGYSDGLFKPNDKINKAEAIKIILTAQGYSVPASVTGTLYSDVKEDDWFAPYVKTAMDNNLLEDTGSTLYVNAFLTRGGMSEMTYRTLVAEGGSFEKAETSDSTAAPIQQVMTSDPAAAEEGLTNLITTFLDADAEENMDDAVLSILDMPEQNYVHNAILVGTMSRDREVSDMKGEGGWEDDAINQTETFYDGLIPSAQKLTFLSPITEKDSDRKITYYHDNSRAYVGVSENLTLGDNTSHFFTCYPFVFDGSWKLKLPSRFSGTAEFTTEGVIESCNKEIKTDKSLAEADFTTAQFSFVTPFSARIYLNGHLIQDAGRLSGGYYDTFLPLVAGKNTLEVEVGHDSALIQTWAGGLLKEGDFEKMYELDPEQMKVQIDKNGTTLVEVSMFKSQKKVTKEFDFQP